MSVFSGFAVEEIIIPMCRSSRVITFRFDSKTQLQMFPLLYGRHVGVHVGGHQHGVSIQSSINYDGSRMCGLTGKLYSFQIFEVF